MSSLLSMVDQKFVGPLNGRRKLDPKLAEGEGGITKVWNKNILNRFDPS